MKIIWNEEPTAPEAPFFAAPMKEEAEFKSEQKEEKEEEEGGKGFGW